MIITHKFDMAVDRRGPAPLVDAVQGDTNTREIRVSLYITPSPNKKEAWPIPDGTSAFIRFRKPDGSGGVYDTMPDETSAISYSGNTVQALIAPQMLTVPGQVLAQIELNNGDSVLGTFMFKVLVEPDPSVGAMTSEDYVNLTGYVAKEIERILGAGNLPGGDEVVISSEEPTNKNAKIWINPDEEESGGLMIVTTTEIEGDTVCISSHGSAEINEHIINGGAAILIHNKRFYYPYQVTSKYVFFRHIFAMGSRNIIYTMTVRDEYPGYDHPVALPSSSENYVVNVPTAEVGQTAIVTAVDSDGRPTNWKAVDYQPRTHYKDTVELFNDTLTGLSTGEVLIEGFSMQAGETYYVTWNGVEYTCVCAEAPDMGGACYIGNGVLLELEDTGEPFAILYGTEDGMNYFTIAVAIDGVDEADVVIKGTGYIPIPTPYLTNAFPYYIDVSTAEDGTMSIEETAAELLALINSGRTMIARKSARDDTNGYTETIHIPLFNYYVHDNGSVRLLFHTKFANLASLFVVIDIADGIVSVSDNID